MNKKLILIGLLLTVLIAIPLTLFLLTQSQVTTTKASPATHLTFIPASKSVTVGDVVKFDVDLDPGSDSSTRNTITFVNLQFQYNAQVFEPASGVGENGTGLVINGYKGDDGSSQPFVKLEPPSISCSEQCVIRVSLGVQPKAPIDQLQHAIVSISVHVKAATQDGSTAKIDLSPGSKVLSIGANDQASDNVLIPVDGAQITIAAAPTPTQTPSSGGGNGGTTPTPTTGDTGGGGNNGTGGSGGTNITPTAQQLTCSSLTADNTSTNSAPLASVFTAAGTAATGVVSKVTFNFGDGSVQDVTSAGGIGTDSVNVQVNHTYKSNGTFTATATLTGDSGAISNPSSCSQVITVGSSGGGGTTPTPESKPLPSTGPGETLMIVGTIGTLIAVGGALLFFGL